MPKDWPLWALARGVSHQLEGVGGRRDSKEEDFLFWMWCQVLTLLLDHGGQQAAQKGFWEYKSLPISLVRYLILLDCCNVGGRFVVFLVVVTKSWQRRCFWYVLRTLNRFGQREHSILEKSSFLLWNLGRGSASFFTLHLYLPKIMQSFKLWEHFPGFIPSVFMNYTRR